jgi:hypothetical protein
MPAVPPASSRWEAYGGKNTSLGLGCSAVLAGTANGLLPALLWLPVDLCYHAAGQPPPLALPMCSRTATAANQPPASLPLLVPMLSRMQATLPLHKKHTPDEPSRHNCAHGRFMRPWIKLRSRTMFYSVA